MKFEEFDGDVHVDLRTDDGEKLVVEVIPQDRGVVPIPDTGARVTVVGPQRLGHGARLAGDPPGLVDLERPDRPRV